MRRICPKCNWHGFVQLDKPATLCPDCGYVFPEEPTHSEVSTHGNKQTERCRKCGFVQAIGSKACNRCGLLFSVARRLPQSHVFDGLPETPLSETLRARWRDLEAHLEDRDSHFKFIELCHTSNQIKFAGYCYRKALSETEDEDTISLLKTYQSRVIQRATAELVVRPSKSNGGRSTHSLIMLTIGALLILGLAFVYFQWSQSSANLHTIP